MLKIVPTAAMSCNSWVLEYHIQLHVDDALDSLYDHLNRRIISPLRGNGNKYSKNFYLRRNI